MKVYLAVTVVVLIALSGAPVEGAVNEGRAPLYLAPGDGGSGTFTSIPPNATNPISFEPTAVVVSNTYWSFFRVPSPASWTLPSDEPVVAHLFFGNLGQTVPADPDPDPTNPTDLHIDVWLYLNELADYGQVDYAIEPPGDPAASGRGSFEPSTLSGTDETALTVRLDTPNDIPVEENGVVHILIRLRGFAPADQRPALHLLSTERASRVDLPGYPVDLLRAAEEALQEEERCRQLLLHGSPCDVTKTPESENVETPGPTMVAFGASVLFVLALSQRWWGKRQ